MTEHEFEQAIADQIDTGTDDEPIVTGWLLIASFSTWADGNNQSSFWCQAPTGQNAAVTRGLADLVSEWAVGSTQIWETDD